MKTNLLAAMTAATALFAFDAAAQDHSSTGTSSTTSTTTTTTPSITTTPTTMAPAPSGTTTSTSTTATLPTAAAPATRPTTTTSGVLDTSSTSSSPATPVDEPTTETPSPINRPLLITGVVLLGGTYGASAIDAAESARPEDHKYLYYPVVGPWMDLANRDCTATPCGHGANEPFNKALIIADGAVQGIGALLMITSLFVPEKATRKWILLGNNEVQAGPTQVGTGYGLGAVGRF